MSRSHPPRMIITTALLAALVGGFGPEVTAGELFPYNPPPGPIPPATRTLPRQATPDSGESPSPRFYEDFGSRARKLPPDERQKLRAVLFENMNKAIDGQDGERAKYYWKLIKSAGF